jgi:glucose-fructose oxidoreductase
MRTNFSRRSFLKSAILAASAPMILPSRILFGAETPSKRVTTGHIGVGGQGGGLLGGFLGVGECQPVAAADPFKSRAQGAAQRMGNGAKAYQDFRELLARDDIDAVVIATPDHWHVPIAIAAVRAGKDVYVEKPLGISIAHNKALRQVVHQYGAMFQYGTQQRCMNTHCAFICELVRNGYIGELKAIEVLAPNGVTGGNPAPQPVPADLDYEMWLGPAPVMPYTHDRVVGQGRWFIYDYAIGFLGGWGAHPLDIAHWGYPHTPVEYEGTGVIPTEGLFDTIVNWDVKGRYASGVEFTLKASGANNTKFIGTEGWVEASRGGRNASSPALLNVKIKPEEIHLLQSNNHHRNFIQAVKTRRTPASDIDSAVQSDFISHLSDITIRTGRKIQWDEKTEEIIGDPVASRMTTRPMREPWTL